MIKFIMTHCNKIIPAKRVAGWLHQQKIVMYITAGREFHPAPRMARIIEINGSQVHFYC